MIFAAMFLTVFQELRHHGACRTLIILTNSQRLLLADILMSHAHRMSSPHHLHDRSVINKSAVIRVAAFNKPQLATLDWQR